MISPSNTGTWLTCSYRRLGRRSSGLHPSCPEDRAIETGRSRDPRSLRENEGALIRDLRDALDPDVPLIAGDAFMPSEGLVALAGPLGRHALVGEPGASTHDRRGRHPRRHPLRRERRPRRMAGDLLPRRRAAAAQLDDPGGLRRLRLRSRDHGSLCSTALEGPRAGSSANSHGKARRRGPVHRLSRSATTPAGPSRRPRTTNAAPAIASVIAPAIPSEVAAVRGGDGHAVPGCRRGLADARPTGVLDRAVAGRDPREQGSPRRRGCPRPR